MDNEFLSIFDSDTNTTLFKNCSNILQNNEYIQKGTFYEYNTNKLFNYYLNKTHFIFNENNTNKYLEIKLKWTQIKFYKNNNKYNLVFKRKYNNFHIYFINKDEYSLLKKNLYDKSIQMNFHKKFKVEKLIGKGGNARVYLVTENDSGQQYAVKAFVKDKILEEKKGIEGLKNEINIMKKVNHPNIVKLIELHETFNSLYLVLEWVEGGELLKKSKTFKYIEVVHIIKNILLGIKYLNSLNIMHRDLKLENILLSKNKNIWESKIKIIDLGLATKINKSSYIFKRCGTPGYVAPEIISKEFYNEKVDVFSIGIIFMILITGKKVFIGDDLNDILNKNSECNIDFQILDKLPNSLSSLIKRMLEKNNLKRITINEALSDIVFIEYDKIEKGSRSIQELNKLFNPQNIEISLNIQTRSIKSKLNNNSFVQKSQNWNGEITSINDSNSWLKNKKKNKRESIFKYIEHKNNKKHSTFYNK